MTNYKVGDTVKLKDHKNQRGLPKGPIKVTGVLPAHMGMITFAEDTGEDYLMYSANCYELVQEEVDPYAELKQAYKEGKIIQIHNGQLGWMDALDSPRWALSPKRYRIKPEPVKTHVHAELMKAYADDSSLTIQFRNSNGWIVTEYPNWDPKLTYRIAPDTEAIHAEIESLNNSMAVTLKAIVDGEQDVKEIVEKISKLREQL